MSIVTVRRVAAGIALLTVGLALLAAPVYAQDGGIALGTKPPSVVVQSLDGKPVDLSRVVGPGPALIEFWATWCPNCKELEPALVAAQTKYAGRVTFVTVAVAINESFDRVRKHAAAHKMAPTVVYDADGYTGVGGTQDLDAAIRKAL